MPGTSVETFQHSQFFNATSSLQTNVNGQPRVGNNFQIEGIDNNERTGLLQIIITPAEAIQQVSVSTTNHDPELGRATGAVVNLMIKSGTNNYHGAAYEFLQNSAFDARSFFNPSVGHLAYNYVWAATLVGPSSTTNSSSSSTTCALWTGTSGVTCNPAIEDPANGKQPNKRRLAPSDWRPNWLPTSSLWPLCLLALPIHTGHWSRCLTRGRKGPKSCLPRWPVFK